MPQAADRLRRCSRLAESGILNIGEDMPRRDIPLTMSPMQVEDFDIVIRPGSTAAMGVAFGFKVGVRGLRFGPES